MTGSHIRRQDCCGSAVLSAQVLGRFILPFFKSFGKVDTAVQEKGCHDSDKLIKLSLLSIICIAKKKNLNFLCTV